MDVQALVAANALSAETLPRNTSLTKQTDAKGGRFSPPTMCQKRPSMCQKRPSMCPLCFVSPQRIHQADRRRLIPDSFFFSRIFTFKTFSKVPYGYCYK